MDTDDASDNNSSSSSAAEETPQKYMFVHPTCVTCGAAPSQMACGICRGGGYCSQACQMQDLQAGKHEHECRERRAAYLLDHVAKYVAMNRTVVRELFHIYLAAQEGRASAEAVRKGAVVLTIAPTRAGKLERNAALARKTRKKNRGRHLQKVDQENAAALEAFSEKIRKVPANPGGRSAKELVQASARRFVSVDDLGEMQGRVALAIPGSVINVNGILHEIYNINPELEQQLQTFVIVINAEGASCYVPFTVTGATKTD